MNNLRLINLLIIPIYFLLLGCASDKTHYVEYYGSFFYDSVTIDAIRIEYDQSSSQGVTGINYTHDNVEQWLDFYNIPLAKVTRSTLIAKNLRGPINVQTKFAAPWLLYQIRRETDCVEMMNVETGQKWTITKHFDYPNGISSNGNYLIIGESIIKREDGSVFRNSNLPGIPFYFDEDSMFLLLMVNGLTPTSTDIVKFNLIDNKSDTIIMPQQRNTTRIISSNKYVIVNAIDTNVIGESFNTCGIVSLNTFLSGDFIAVPLNSHICDGEYLPEKGYWVTGEESIYFGNIQDSIYPTNPILKATWRKK
jgi:hypothetical protein